MTMIETLKEKAKNNKTLDAMCYMFAIRQRARSTIRVHSLMQRMHKEGFDFGKEEYEGAIKIMADVQIGDLMLNRNGRVIGLSSIRYTLQSIGAAVCEGRTPVASNRPRNRFIAAPAPKKVVPALVQEKTVPTLTQVANPGLTITLREGITVNFPKDANAQDIVKVVNKLLSA